MKFEEELVGKDGTKQIYNTLNIGSGLYKNGDVTVDITPTVRPTVVADAQHLPFREGIFDRITCYHVLEHLTSPSQALTEMSQVLSEKGRAEIIVPHPWLETFHKRLSERHYEATGHKVIFTKKLLSSLTKRAGFNLIDLRCRSPLDYFYILFAVATGMEAQQTMQGKLQQLELHSPTLIFIFSILKRVSYRIPFPSAYVVTLRKRPLIDVVTPPKPKIDLIIINWNGKQHLERCLPALLNTRKLSFSGYVIDNASTDGSVEYIMRNFPQFKVIKNSENLGFARAANKAIANSNGDIICIMNNDIVVSPNWLSELAKTLTDPKVVIAVPKMYDFEGRLNGAGGVCDIYGFAYNRGILEKDVGQYDSKTEIPYGCFAVALVKRDLLKKIGIFDEDYFIYHEDVDLCWRTILHGYKIVYCPGSVVYHQYMGTTFPKEKRHGIIYHWERNRFQTLLKNYQLSTLIKISLVIGILKILHIIYAIRHRDLLEVFAVIRAYFWNILHLRKTVKKRRRVQLLRRLSDSNLTQLTIPYSLELRLGLGKIYHPIARRK